MSQVAKVETMSQAPAVTAEATTILQIIQQVAMSPSADIDKMERLMAMHERLQAQQAKQQYDEALAKMQEELPVIGERGGIKDKNGRIQSTYALWEDINEMIKPVLARHGFGLSFRTPRNERGIEVEGVLSHRSGHRETTSLLLPADTTGSKNGVQAVASSVSYGKRYTAGALLNFTTTGEDDDGNGAVVTPRVTSVQAAQLAMLLERCSERAKNAFANIHGTPSAVEKAAFDQVLGMLSKSVKQHEASAEEAKNEDHN
ncbi:ERF family protein [Pseudomonas syringae group genomosp. 3]|uniref:ERF family protein n=1 Tax=Pseudomonas syringae group genomosp. 3 TaxID=251701 RepID=UPI0006B9D53E|nr:ERF family protein [Pseudomonas syringae group genomosp. 3]KPB95710.1 Single-stranded DNA-binding protein [Pseudomonas syringae pv. maculicola]